MSTSGLYGRTQVDVLQIIEEAFRRCGQNPSTVSGEQLASAKLNLFTLTSALSNRGLSLWCIQKYVFGVQAYAENYTLPDGTYNLLSALFRTSTTLEGSPLSGANYYGVQLTDTVAVPRTIGVQFSAAGTTTLVVESSTDGSAWTQRAEGWKDLSVAAGQWLYIDVDNSVPAEYWRVRDTAGALPTVGTFVAADNLLELPMAPLNRDDYTSLPNKAFAASTGAKSLQYWFDKQVAPRFWVWPVMNSDAGQIVTWLQMQIQDVGSLSDSLDVPQRWLEGLFMLLASRVALIIPADKLPPGRLEFVTEQAEKYLLEAENGENDGAPINLAPNIRGYTR